MNPALLLFGPFFSQGRMADATNYEPVSVEDSHGRILTGVEVTPDELTATMARHAPETEPSATAAPAEDTAASTPARDESGKFTSPTAEPETPVETPPDAHPETPKKPRGNTKTREEAIERATWLRRQAEERAASLEAEAARLKAELDSLKRPAPTAQPSAAGFPTEEQYFAQHPDAPYSAYWDAKLDWKLAQVEQQRQAQAAQQHVSTQVDTFNRNVLAKYPDFDGLVQEAAAAGLRFSQPLSQALLSHPQGIDWAYQLVKDPATAQRLSSMDPVALGLALASLGGGSSVPTAQETRPRTSAAPAPIQPVGSGSKTTAPSLDQLADKGDDYDSSGYREARAAQRRALGRR